MKTKIFTIIVSLAMLVLSPVFGLAQSAGGDNATSTESMAKNTKVDSTAASSSAKPGSVGVQLQKITDELSSLKNELKNDRHQTVKDLQGELVRYLLIGLLVLVIALLIVGYLLWKKLAPERTPRDGSKQGPMTDVDKAVAKSKGQKFNPQVQSPAPSTQQELEIKQLRAELQDQKEAIKRLEQNNEQLRKDKEELKAENDMLKRAQVSAPLAQPTPQPTSTTAPACSKYYIDNLPSRTNGELLTEPKATTFLEVNSDGTFDIRRDLGAEEKGSVIRGAGDDVPLLKKKGGGGHIVSTEPGKVTIDPASRSWILERPLTLVLSYEQP